MADIVLRNVDADLKNALRQRAKRNRRSMNTELLDIVRMVLIGETPAPSAGPSLQSLAIEIRALSAAQAQTPSQDLLHIEP